MIIHASSKWTLSFSRQKETEPLVNVESELEPFLLQWTFLAPHVWGYILFGIGSGNVAKQLNFLLGGVDGLGVVPGLVGCLWWGHVIILFTRCFTSEGPTSSQCGCVFLVLNAFGFGVGFVSLLSQSFFKFIYKSELESRRHTHLEGRWSPSSMPHHLVKAHQNKETNFKQHNHGLSRS